jgi:hypothetical protein
MAKSVLSGSGCTTAFILDFKSSTTRVLSGKLSNIPARAFSTLPKPALTIRSPVELKASKPIE